MVERHATVAQGATYGHGGTVLPTSLDVWFGPTFMPHRKDAKNGIIRKTGFQGYLPGPQAKQWKVKVGAASSDVLLDPKGTVGRAYGARTTPHMYVVDKAGTLVYMGAIDDRPGDDDPGAISLMHKLSRKSRKRWPEAAIDFPRRMPPPPPKAAPATPAAG